MTTLVILALDGNNIAKLELSLCGLVNLEELFLQNNMLFGMPSTLMAMQALQVLNIAGNALETLPQVHSPLLLMMAEILLLTCDEGTIADEYEGLESAKQPVHDDEQN
jgi:Leucine-rich repeat (LRR) protein